VDFKRLRVILIAIVLVLFASISGIYAFLGMQHKGISNFQAVNKQQDLSDSFVYVSNQTMYLANTDNIIRPLFSSNISSFVYSPFNQDIIYLKQSGENKEIVDFKISNNQSEKFGSGDYSTLISNPSNSILFGVNESNFFPKWKIIKDSGSLIKDILPDNMASIGWVGETGKIVYVRGQTDVSLKKIYLYDLIASTTKNILSSHSDFVGSGVTSASCSNDGKNIFLGISFKNSQDIQQKNGIYEYDINSDTLKKVKNLPGESVYMIHVVNNDEIVYATGKAFPYMIANLNKIDFFKLNVKNDENNFLFSLNIDKFPLSISWLANNRNFLFYKDHMLWLASINISENPKPINQASNISWFSGGGDWRDLTTVMIANTDNLRFSVGLILQNPVNSNSNEGSVHSCKGLFVKLSPDSSMVVEGSDEYERLIKSAKYAKFIVLPNRVVAGERFGLNYKAGDISEINAKAQTGNFPSNPETVEYLLPGGVSAGNNLQLLKNSNLYLWIPKGKNGEILAGLYLVYIGRSYNDPLLGHFEWIKIDNPIKENEFIDQTESDICKL